MARARYGGGGRSRGRRELCEGLCQACAIPGVVAMVAAVTSQFVRLETLAHQDRRLLRFTGADVGRFLQGVLSADVQQLRSGHAQAAAILTVKGKIISDAIVLCDAEGRSPSRCRRRSPTRCWR
jgi:hypothetical protein